MQKNIKSITTFCLKYLLDIFREVGNTPPGLISLEPNGGKDARLKVISSIDSEAENIKFVNGILIYSVVVFDEIQNGTSAEVTFDISVDD